MAMIAQTPRTRHQNAQFKAAATRSTALAPISVGDHMSRKIARDCDRHVELMANSPPFSPPNRPAKPQARRPAPTAARPFGAGVLVYAASLPTPARRDDRDDDGSLSPSARNGKPADAVSDRDKADWIAQCAEREARALAHETMADYREQESRDAIMASFVGSRYEVSFNPSGFVTSDW